MPDLKPHQMELLRFLVERNAPTPVASLDGRNLRPLKAQGMVVELDGRVSVTETGREAAAPQNSNPVRAAGTALTDSQEAALRYLVRQTGPVPEEHLDGRVLRALRAQNLVTERAGWVSPAEGARARLDGHMARQRTARQRVGEGAASARAEAIRRAADQLEAALPRDAEINVADMPVYGDDVVAAIRRLAKDMGAGKGDQFPRLPT